MKVVKVGSTKLGNHVQKPSSNKEKRVSKAKFAEHLRKNPTQSEQIIRQALLDKQINFQFQTVVFGYIPDFYFPEQKKIVELDGKWCHDREKDQKRDEQLRTHGIKTLRIRSHRAFWQLGRVLEEIQAFLACRSVPKRSKQTRKRKRALKQYRTSLEPDLIKLYRSPTYREFLHTTEGL